MSYKNYNPNKYSERLNITNHPQAHLSSIKLEQTNVVEKVVPSFKDFLTIAEIKIVKKS